MSKFFSFVAAVAALACSPAFGQTAPIAGLEGVTLEAVAPCEGEPTVPRFPDEEEMTRIRSDPQASRSGRRIRVQEGAPADHPSVLRIGQARFVDTTLGVEVGQRHTYLGRYTRAPIALVSVQGYETYHYLLVDPATGRTATIDGVAALALDGRTFVYVFWGDGVVEGSTLGVAEWRDGRFHTYSFERDACGLSWEGPGRLTFRIRPGAQPGGHLERRPEGWALVAPDGEVILREHREDEE